jgi:hypothetical protein
MTDKSLEYPTTVSHYLSERVVSRDTQGSLGSGCDAESRVRFGVYVQSWPVSNRDAASLGGKVRKQPPDPNLPCWGQAPDYRNRAQIAAAEACSASATVRPKTRRSLYSHATPRISSQQKSTKRSAAGFSGDMPWRVSGTQERATMWEQGSPRMLWSRPCTLAAQALDGRNPVCQLMR